MELNCWNDQHSKNERLKTSPKLDCSLVLVHFYWSLGCPISFGAHIWSSNIRLVPKRQLYRQLDLINIDSRIIEYPCIGLQNFGHLQPSMAGFEASACSMVRMTSDLSTATLPHLNPQWRSCALSPRGWVWASQNGCASSGVRGSSSVTHPAGGRCSGSCPEPSRPCGYSGKVTTSWTTPRK